MSIVMEQERPRDGRNRLVLGAIELLRERGLVGASFGEVVKRTGAPRGSIYHHFPGGKDALVVEAVGLVGSAVATAVADAAAADPRQAASSLVGAMRWQLDSTDFAGGCPVVGVVAASGDAAPEVLDAAAGAFDAWTRALADALVAHGVPADEAVPLADVVVAAIEGAVLLARARRSPAPLEHVAAHVDRILADALERAAGQ